MQETLGGPRPRFKERSVGVGKREVRGGDVQVRSHGMAEVANGGHVTVRIAVGVGQC